MTSRPVEGSRPGRGPVRVRAGRARTKPVDRARWRRRIRSRPRLRGVYRVVVACTGVALMVVALSIGWLPGPGGVPLFLMGLAVLATEFVWAHRLLGRANYEAHRAAHWSARQPRWVHGAMAGATAGAILFGVWLILAIFGVPGWAPDALTGLPGLRPG